MRRRSVFKWTTMAIVAMAIVLNVLSMLQRETVSAAATQTPPQTQGSLQVLDDKGKPSAECPLKHTVVKAHVCGFISRVTVTQDFENNFPEKIEAVYILPMVVAPRYIPTAEPSQELQADANEVTDTSRIPPPSAPDGMRAGHDISLEIDLDAGMPIVGVISDSHETEVEQINRNRAVVRLKDRSTIPNKDFLLNYRVAGDTINDAVLTHRSERGGFFTLILQPPQRVTAEDVMPKELVFVLDVSGSMDSR